jgi:hypothetical protein
MKEILMRRLCLCLLALPLAAAAQPPRSPAPAVAASAAPGQPTYADLADLALPAPVAAHIRLRRALPLRGPDAAGVAPGLTRFFVEAETLALIRGEPGMASQVRYLVDVPNGADGRPPRLQKKSEWLIFARAVPSRPGQLQLTAPDAQLVYTPQIAERLRDILRAGLDAAAPPAISGIGRAFHVPGVLPGASETQLFLVTSRGQPISITVLREPQVEPRWFVSLGEFVDAGATQPPRDSLLWYRLACFLPAQLPEASMAEAGEHRAAVTADYRLVRQGLGPCPRSRVRR